LGYTRFIENASFRPFPEYLDPRHDHDLTKINVCGHCTRWFTDDEFEKHKEKCNG